MAKSTHAGDVLVYRTESNGSKRDLRVRFDSPAHTPLFVAALLSTIFVALAYLVIGTFVFWRLPVDSRAVVFFAMTIFAATSFIGTLIAQFEGQNTRGFVIDTKSAAPLRYNR